MLLFDTNIVSFMFKKHRIGNAYFPMLLGRELAISFQTKAELIAGSLLAMWSEDKCLRLYSIIEQYALIHSDDELCNWWAYVQLVRQEQPISTNDAWIAATALSYDLDLVTHNPKDFRDIPGLRVRSLA
jgi:predicted nucleic acid-binding protein